MYTRCIRVCVAFRMAINELWNVKKGALCLFGICCNSYTKMFLTCILGKHVVQFPSITALVFV